MGRLGKRVGLGMVIGVVAGVVSGFIVALLLHQHAHAFWGYVIGLGVFGLIAGGFVGGMTSLANPGIGEEPSDPLD
jgi:MFS family permease